MRIIITNEKGQTQVYVAGTNYVPTFEVVDQPERFEQLSKRFKLIKAEDIDRINLEMRDDILDRFPLVPPEGLNEKRVGLHKSLDVCYHNGLLFCDVDRHGKVDGDMAIRLMRTNILDTDRSLLFNVRLRVSDLLIAYKENIDLFSDYRIPESGIKTVEDVLVFANAIDWHIGLRNIKIHGGSE